MVFSGETERLGEFMAMGPERSKPLHNFTLPCLKWGTQRYLTCMKVDGNATSVVAASDHHRSPYQRRRSPPSTVTNSSRSKELDSAGHNRHLRERRLRVSEGIEAVREKIMKDLKTAADKMKQSIFRDEVSGGEDEEFDARAEKAKKRAKEREESPPEEVEPMPWNLRTRRAAGKAPMNGVVYNSQKGNNFFPMRDELTKSPRARDRGSSAAADNCDRPEFSVALSRKEIEEDYMEMLGHRPPRRPKKRPRIVQRQLDTLFPGLWLTEVTLDSYKVQEPVDNNNGNNCNNSNNNNKR